MGAGGDVYPVLFVFGIEGELFREIEQSCIHLAEIPGIGNRYFHRLYFSLW